MSKRGGNRFAVHWTPERIVEAIQNWQEVYNEPPRRTDWDPTRCEVLARMAEQRADEWRRRQTTFRIGEFPTPRTVTEAFGSWNAAIEAAGFVPRLPSQRTPRGIEASPLLTQLGSAMNDVYQAEDAGDVQTLRIELRRLAALAEQLADQLEGSEEQLAAELDRIGIEGGVDPL
jgi:hypothetical protein